MKFGASIEGDLAAIATEILQEAEAAVTRGVFASGRGLRDDWRGQVRGAGLGTRLANSVRQADFPRSGTSLRAASLVWTKAPDILHAFDGGVLIRGKDGLWLAIPLPAAGLTGLGRQRITPWRWEQRTGMRLRFVYRRNGPSLLVTDDARLNSRGLAAAKGGRRRRDGVLAGAQTVPVFLLLRQVKMPKKLDLDGLAREATARLPGAILGAWKG
ncbi:DUF6441 family protein [Gemmobacter denitrificans]|uniref:DUF6441 family protein n=1 Tax=Gemmobacter denitrificans TaxID=3123040 RepID=A0ABU8BY78_9RHOB